MKKLRVISYNLYKGRSWWAGHSVIEEMGHAIAHYSPDIVACQELREWHATKAAAGRDLADALRDHHAAHGMNFKGRNSQHGNAIFSRMPIVHFENLDLTVSRLEKRGMLTAECAPDAASGRIRVFCTHLDLTFAGRMKQMERLADEIERRVARENEPFILAGDFNDWNLEGHAYLKKRLGVEEAYEVAHGKLGKTFPSFYPMVRLDRVYFRGLRVESARVLGRRFQFLSDHRPLLVDFAI